MANTTYTTWYIKLNSWSLVQGAVYPDHLNPFMPDINRYKNVIMPFWFDYLGIKRVDCFLYNDSVTRTYPITIEIAVKRWSSMITLYTISFTAWVTEIVDTAEQSFEPDDRLCVWIVSAPTNNSAIEIFFNYSNKETTGQFSNNISLGFEQAIPKVPVWVIKEQSWTYDDTVVCLPSIATNNAWLNLQIWWYNITPQKYDTNRRILLKSSTTDYVIDKTAALLSCGWSTWIWWGANLAAPSANISAMISNNESWTDYVYFASRWLAANTSSWNDTFRLQKYSFNSSTQALSYVARSTAYRTMKTGRSWGWVFALRIWDATGSFAWKVIAWTMLRQQAWVDSKIGWILVYNNTLTLSNTFKRIGNTDASLYGVQWPWYIYEEVSGGVSTITCMAHVTDTTSAVAPYPDKVACLWKYDSTWAITAQYDIRLDFSWNMLYTPKWVTQLWSSAFVFGDYEWPWLWIAKAPFLLEYDKDWNFIAEHPLYSPESSSLQCMFISNDYITYVLLTVSGSNYIVMRYNRTTATLDFSKIVSWINVHYVEPMWDNKLFIHWYSPTNTWSCYGYLYMPWVNGTDRQPTNNFSISQWSIWSPSDWLTPLWVSPVTQVSANPTYTQAVTTQSLSWWTWTTGANYNIFKSLI